LNDNNYDCNVLWSLLRFFQIFRNEGIATLGEHLLGDNSMVNQRQIADVMNRFKENVTHILNLCTGLKYYHNLEVAQAHKILREIAMEAYQYGDLVLLELLKTFHTKETERIELLIQYLSGESSSPIENHESIYFLRKAMQIDLSEYILAIFNNEILNSEEPLSKQQLFECCGIIQNDVQADAISKFSKNIGICVFNKDSELFMQTIREVIGSKMTKDEIIESYQLFLQKEYPEGIVQSIRKKADDLLPLAMQENNEVALWALTYLLDNQDLIHDDLIVLGWQDDWLVVDGAWRILNY